MHATLPHLGFDFPALGRKRLTTLQVNIGYLCNQSCLHCHVNAGPNRVEQMTAETARHVLELAERAGVETLDLTGGAPELNKSFRMLVEGAAALDLHIMDRCNLTVLNEPGQEDLAQFLAHHRIEVVASLPCYSEENVASQRGKGVFESSIEGLHKLNALGYGKPGTGLVLNLVYNPQGPVLPPPQAALEDDYRRVLAEQHGVVFNHLFSLANQPVGRFGSTLISKGKLNDYLDLLRSAHHAGNVEHVMCRNLLSVDWMGYTYDCDFNQMLGLGLRHNGSSRVHISELMDGNLDGSPITVRSHCYACTAGQGSSCGGALA